MKSAYLLLLGLLIAASVFGAAKEVAPAVMVEEGAFFEGIEGLLKKEPKTDRWQFVPDEPIVITDKITVPAGAPLEMLPCSVLEQMTALAGEENQLRIELSALITRYRHSNYLFSVFFLPIKNGVEPPEQPAEPDPNETEKAEPDKPQEPESIIPTAILKQMKANKAPDLKKFQQIAEVTGDVHLIGRSGFLSKTKDGYTFSPDGFGRNIDSKQFVLLDNAMLAAAERQMAREPGRERYNVSGLVTEYNGKTYMLLRRASRTYTHGNFTP
ncbi:MAG: hypothetical protein DRP56_00390 [Planctomycetota bacterium]|nr:MAG: hypothetical protein DRP56_00390 [Planctomycetota bacterium]RKY14112.1 MAG: hypothetical protein DRP52_00960 [Planctomycetota bacterium]